MATAWKGCIAFSLWVDSGSPIGSDPLPERAVFVHIRPSRLWSSGRTGTVNHGTIQDQKVQSQPFLQYKHAQNKHKRFQRGTERV